MSSSSTLNIQPPIPTTTTNNSSTIPTTAAAATTTTTTTTTTTAPSIQLSPSQPTLPPSDAFDFLPLTYDLLARLSPPSSNPPPSSDFKPPSHLEPKDVDTEASRIRLKIQKARALVADLPDISRSLNEQEIEIKELQDKVRRQREALGGIRNLNVVMEAAAADGAH